jgi:hypothetical protein
MAGQSLNFRPTILNLLLYTGDGLSLKLNVKDGAGSPVDISGTVTAQIRADRLHPLDPPLASFSVSLVDAYLGIIGLTLTADQSLNLPLNTNSDRFTGVWDVQWTPVDRQPRTLVQGIVECVPDVTR